MGSIVTRESIRSSNEASAEVTGSDLGTKRYLNTTAVIQGSDGTDIQTVKTTTAGELQIEIVRIIPNAPAMVSATPANEQNTVVWEAVAGATDYIVFFDTTSPVTESSTQIITGSTATTYVHTGLTNGTTYYYKVKAVGAWGNTFLSANEVSGMPAAFINALSTLLDGVDEYVSFGDNHNYEQNVSLTFSCWFKITNLAGANQCLWAKATADANVNGWGLYTTSAGELFLQMRTSTVNRAHTTSGLGLSAGTWYHLVMTYTGGSNINGIRFYLDSSVQSTPASGSLSGTMISTVASQVGRRNSSFPFNGNIDEVSFWSVTMNQTEVTELYNSGTPGDLSTHSQAANLDHWYKAGDGDTHPIWSDNKGTADGTMNNTEPGDFVSDVP